MDDNIKGLDHASQRLALQQWNELRNILVSLGVDVVVLPKPPENCPDAVFTANAGFIYKNTFIPSFFRYRERQVEEQYFINWFKEHGFNVPPITGILNRSEIAFEGAGDALIDSTRNILWYGHGFRSSLSFKEVLERNIDRSLNIIDLKLVNPSFYHLDTCFCPTDTGKLIWYPAAFDEASQIKIRQVYGDSGIEVNDEDAATFACNAISLGNRIILPFVSSELLTKIVKQGLEPIRHDLSQYLKSGGSAKCLILKIQ